MYTCINIYINDSVRFCDTHTPPPLKFFRVAAKEGSERKYRFAGREGREEKKERKKKNLVLFASCLGCGEERGDIIIDLRNDQKSKGHEMIETG